MAGDFILFLDSKLDTEDENPTMKKKSLNKFFKLKESYLIPGELKKKQKKPPTSKRFTFAQKHSSVLIRRRLDYMFISNTLQEFVTMKEALTPISTDYALYLLSFKRKGCCRDKGF